MQEISKIINEMVGEFKNPFIEKMFSQTSQGKMLRSSMILSIAGRNDESLRLCAIVELIQLASLLHDDVIDESSMRRGQKSLHSLFDSKSAIMLGDALYSKAFYHLSFFPQTIAKSLSDSVCKLSSGEIYDVFLAQDFNPLREKYFLMIEEKTASLIASSAECAAILAGLDAEAYFHYGKCLGVAFQMIDDILDITQPQEVLGKPAMSDFKEGKTTLPYLLLFEKLPQEEQNHLQNLCGKKLTSDEEQWILQNMEKWGCIEESKHLAREIAKDAFTKLAEPYPNKLEEIMQAMIARSF